jgi:FemAB-related protein (PEP-CTERM system-associated)
MTQGRADAAITVAEAAPGDREAWTRYLDASADATLFHDLRWGEAVADAYGYGSVNLVARREGAVVGVLPLTDVRSALFGRSLISTAFAIGGGVVADDAAAHEALAVRALDLGREFGVNYVELRGGPAPAAGYVEKSGHYVSFSKELPADEEAVLTGLPKNRRHEVRKSERLERNPGFRYRVGGSPREFHRLYADSVRHLGTPVFPQKFPESLAARFGDDMEIAIVELDGKPAATLLSFWRGARVMPYYIGGTQAARAARAFDYLYFQLMRRAVLRGARIFDFGRSKVGSTHFDTKKYWGFEPSPIVYHVGLVRAKELPNVSPTNPKFALVSAAWRRLPAFLADRAGPLIARHLA